MNAEPHPQLRWCPVCGAFPRSTIRGQKIVTATFQCGCEITRMGDSQIVVVACRQSHETVAHLRAANAELRRRLAACGCDEIEDEVEVEQ